MKRRCAIGSTRTSSPTPWRYGRQPRWGGGSISPHPQRASTTAVAGPAPACDAMRSISRSACAISPAHCPRGAGARSNGARERIQLLASRFARVRARAAHKDRPREEEWLLIEWPHGEAEPTHYFLSNLPETVSLEELVATVKMRWRIERDYLELKQELGLGHYEGRNWRGFHHHASLCIAAYGFLMLERLSGVKKNTARLQAPALPEGFRPRGAGPDAAPRPVVDRHRAPSPGLRHRATASAMPMLQEIIPAVA